MVYSEREIQSAERFPRSLQTTITPNGARTKQDLEVMSHFRASAEKSLPKWRSSFDKSDYPDCHMLSTRALRNRSREGIGGERTPCSPQPGSRTDRGIKGNRGASAEFNAPQVERLKRTSADIRGLTDILCVRSSNVVDSIRSQVCTIWTTLMSNLANGGRCVAFFRSSK